jgi:HD-like signal output (HDOD) protein
MARFETPSKLVTGRAHDPTLDRAHEIVDAAANLTPLSHSAAQLIALNSTPNVSTTDLVAVIANDQVLAATLLREANSAASAAADPISTVDVAVVRLGMAKVLSSSVRLSLSKQMSGPVPEYDLAEGDLGRLSIVGSIGAEIVREQAKVKMRPELITAARLRDIGMLVLVSFLDSPHRLLLDVVRESGADLAEGERMVLDASHGEAGGLLCQHWKLPEAVRLGVQYHHDPFECPDPIAHGVFLADTIAHHVALRTGGTWSHATPTDEAVAESAAAIGFDISRLDALVDVAIARFEARNTGLTLVPAEPS